MNREEATIILDTFKNNPLFNEQHKQAFDMAISALSENKTFEGMTNGEVIKALFPQCYFLNTFPFEGSSMEKLYIDNNKDNKTHIMVQAEWWNAPYKAESEVKDGRT